MYAMLRLKPLAVVSERCICCISDDCSHHLMIYFRYERLHLIYRLHSGAVRPQYPLIADMVQGCTVIIAATAGGACNIVFTQLRRISAVGLAHRVAQVRLAGARQTWASCQVS